MFVRNLLFLIIVLLSVTVHGAVTVTVNGSNHTIPQTNEKGWGNNVTAWIQSISANTLQPSGGTFTLTADTNFGANFGLVSTYYKSRTANPSSVGVLRLSNNEGVAWRNAANSADLLLKVNASNALEFNGVALPTGSAGTFQDSTFSIYDNADATKLIAFQASGISTATTRTITMPDANVDLGDVTNAVSTNTASRIVKRDASGNFAAGTITAALAGNVTGALTGNASTATALAADPADCAANNFATTIAANGALTCAQPTVANLVALTVSRAAVTDASGFLSAATTTATEIGYVNGVTSAIQTQLDAKQSRATLTTKGDIYVATAASTVARQGVGADGLFLRADSAQTNGVIWASASGAALAVTSKTTTYTATNADDFIAVTTAAAWTLTLYATAGNTGKVLRIKKTSSDLNALTIDGNLSETIDGALTTTINTQHEELTIISDGTNWHILDRVIPSVWVGYTPTTAALGTVTGVGVFSRRIGDSLEVQGGFTCGTSTGATVQIGIGFGGTADNVTIDTTKHSAGRLTGNLIVGFVEAGHNSILMPGTNQTYVNAGRGNATLNPAAAQIGTNICSSGQDMQFYFRVPIVGWKG